MREEINEVFSGTIERIETYGLYVSFPRGTAIILIVDVAQRRTDLSEEFQLGELVEFRVLTYIPEETLYKGEIVGGRSSPRHGGSCGRELVQDSGDFRFVRGGAI